MRKNLILSVATACCCMSVAAAQEPIDKVFARDGSVYEGYISDQIPGDRICIYAGKATIVIPAGDVIDSWNECRPVKNLSRAAQEYCRELGDSVTTCLTSLYLKDGVVDDVVVLDRSDSLLRYISFANKTYTLQWKDVERTLKCMSTEEPWGILDVITTTSGEQLKGFVVEQLIGKSLKIKTVDNVTRVVAMEDVVSIRSEAIDHDADVWSQVRLLDQLVFDDKSEVTGFITSRVLGSKVYVMIAGSNRERVVPIDEITRYRKLWNEGYKEYVTDTAKVFALNGESMSQVSTFIEKDFRYVPAGPVVSVRCMEPVAIEVHNLDHSRTALLYGCVEKKYRGKEHPELRGQKLGCISVDAMPVYESPFVIQSETCSTCEIIVRKPGRYILSIDGLDAVLVLEAK